MKVEQFCIDPLGVNCYLVYQGQEAVLVDPGGPAQQVLDFAENQGLVITAIVNTHGHADHIAGNAWFMEKTGAPLYLHEFEEPYLSDPLLHLGPQIQQQILPVQPRALLKEGDRLEVGGAFLEVWHTPGHSPGSISLYYPGLVLSGDTLFKSSVGRWDLPEGDHAVLLKSLQRLALAPPETVVYPGHGPATTIADELQDNPFL